jgi:hypothetical protein
VIGGRKDKLRSGDALYLRNFETMPADIAASLSPRASLLKLLAVTLAWRYVNYALELADYGRRHDILDAAEFSAIVEPLAATVDLSDRTPNMPGREALARLFDVLSYALQPNMKKGVPHAFNGLGNHWIVRRHGRRPHQVRLHCPVLRSGAKARTKIVELGDPPGSKVRS